MCAMSHSVRVCGDVPSLPEVNEDRYVMVSLVAGITAVWRKRKAACRAARIGTEAQRRGSEQRRRQAHRDVIQRRCVTLVRLAWLFVVFLCCGVRSIFSSLYFAPKGIQYLYIPSKEIALICPAPRTRAKLSYSSRNSSSFFTSFTGQRETFSEDAGVQSGDDHFRF